MKVSDYNLILILTGMILGLAGQFYNNFNLVSLGLIVFLYSLYRNGGMMKILTIIWNFFDTLLIYSFFSFLSTLLFVALFIDIEDINRESPNYYYVNMVWCLSLFIVFLVRKHLLGNSEKKCAWCNSKKIKFKSGEEGNFYWKYRNNDGSQDKRIKDNVQKASFFSTYVCEECNAITNFYHLVDKDPSQSAEIHKRTLNKNGTGERKGSDWKDTSTITVDTKSPNRKGD